MTYKRHFKMTMTSLDDHVLTVPRRYFFYGSFVLFMSCLFMISRFTIIALWSPAGKGLTSWLLFVMFKLCFCHFLMW